MTDAERLIEKAGETAKQLTRIAAPDVWASQRRSTAHDAATQLSALVTALRAERERADKATLEALELKQRGRSLELVSADAIRERDELAAGLRSANALYETCKIDRDEYAAANLAANKRIVELEHERDEARSKLSRLTTPRPIAEAPKDGTPILGFCPSRQPQPWRTLFCNEGWYLCGAPSEVQYHPTHFLPLPVKP